MPASTATHTRNQFSLMSDRYFVTATITSPSDAETWDTGLSTVDAAGFAIEEASGSASDAISIGSISNGTITLDVQGTVGSARAWAVGS